MDTATRNTMQSYYGWQIDPSDPGLLLNQLAVGDYGVILRNELGTSATDGLGYLDVFER
jgi:hypothetical protein